MRRDWAGLVATGAFAVVALVAAVVSYDHIRIVTGDHWYSVIMPFSVDGLLVAGSIALWRDRRDGHRGSILAWASVILGLIWSLGANLAATNQDLIPRAVVEPLLAVWPPVALALAFELLIGVVRRDAPPALEIQDPVVDEPEPVERVEPRTVADAVADGSPTPWSFDDAVAWAAREGAGAKRIQAHTGLSEYRAKKAAAEAKKAPPRMRVAR